MNMPILESQTALYEKDDNVVILHINHCMDNSFYFCEQLKKVFHEVVFIAAPYNNKEVDSSINYPCYYAVNTGEEYIVKRNGETVKHTQSDFTNVTYTLIELALDNEISGYVKQGKKVIIIEDGGYHHNVITSIIERREFLSGAILGAVEQTTAGTRKAHLNKHYPVLSVARSIYKTRIESYFIANTVIRDICRMLNSINIFLDFKHVYILGYGIVGRPIAHKAATHGAFVHVYDIDRDILNIAEQDNYQIHTGNDIAFQDDAIVIGCAGEPSFTACMLDSFLNGSAETIYLASASSKQTEFSDIYEILKKHEKWRTEFCVGYVFPNGKEIVMLADGYPVNFFDENTVSLTYSMIDIVFTEMALLAIYLKEKKGVHENKTYLLSENRLIDSFVREDNLIAQWGVTHKLSLTLNGFNIHPGEHKLKYNSIR